MTCSCIVVLLTALAVGCSDGNGGDEEGGRDEQASKQKTSEQETPEEKVEPPAENPAEPWDINGDGHPVLVIGAPKAEVPGEEWAGAFAVFAGSADGPDPDQGSRLDRASEQVAGSPEAEDGFGSTIASGDFDGDGHADLAVCADEQMTGTDMTLLFGGEQQLGSSFTLPGPGKPDQCRDLIVADVDGNGYDDLIVGGSDRLAWAPGGPDASDADNWEFQPIDKEAPSYGHTDLAVGDFDGDGRIDVTYHVELIDHGYERRIRFGTDDGFGDAHSPGEGSGGYPWGGAADFGDVDDDGYDDLVVLAEGEGLEIWYGAEEGISEDQTPDFISFDALGLPGEGDGGAIALSDGPGPAELTVSGRGLTVDGHERAGALVRVPGSSDGPDTSEATVVHQGTDGVPGSLEDGDRFGASPRYLDVDGDDRQELIVGAFGENDKAGRAYVLGEDEASFFRPEDADITEGDSWFGR